MPDPAYVYRATCRRVKDGDTFIADVDLGFYVSTAVTVRLAGVNTPEIHSHDGEQRAKAHFAAAFLASLFYEEPPVSVPLTLASHKDQRSFERWVCDVWLSDGRSVADVLIEAGHGTRVER